MHKKKQQLILSIVIPTYNRAKYLERCLESVIAQQGNFFEIVVSDNASPDNTQEMIQRFLSDTRIRYFRNSENLGGRENIYKATHYSQGQYVFWLADDDYLLPNALDKVLDIISLYPDIGYVYSPVITVDDRNGKVFYRRDDFETSTLINAGLENLTNVMSSAWVFSRQILRRDLIDWKTWDKYKKNAYYIIIVAGRIILERSAYYISEDLVMHSYYNEVHWEEFGDSKLEIELVVFFDHRNCMRAVLHDHHKNKDINQIIFKWENDSLNGLLNVLPNLVKQFGWFKTFYFVQNIYKPSFSSTIKILSYLLTSLFQILKIKVRIRSRLKELIN